MFNLSHQITRRQRFVAVQHYNFGIFDFFTQKTKKDEAAAAAAKPQKAKKA